MPDLKPPSVLAFDSKFVLTSIPHIARWVAVPRRFLVNAVGAACLLGCAADVPASNYDLSRDFPSPTNPLGAWSLGWKPTLEGEFSLLPFRGTQPDPSGGIYEWWVRTPSGPASVYRNAGTATLVSDGGLGVYPPGTVWFGAGADGAPDNFGVIRFTVPPGFGGNYEVAAVVRCRLDGPLSRDGEFHVVHNQVAVFAQMLAPNSATSYTNVLSLAPGDTIDFLTGRGPDGTEHGGGLKISVTITPRLDAPVAITNQPQNRSVHEGEAVRFSVGAAGSPPPTFQWLRNGSAIPGGTNDTYLVARAQPTDDGAIFRVIAANLVSNVTYRATSSVATLIVIADTTAPALASVRSLGLNLVRVHFSEPVTSASATDLRHYTLIGPGGPVAVTGATLDPTQTDLLLSVAPMTAQATYMLTVDGVRDTAAAGNSLVNAQASFLALPLAIALTEFLAENVTGRRDADGDASDWIELQNQTLFSVDLAGWRLTDDRVDLAKWIFPTAALSPGQFLVVFASDKDRRDPGAELHTNFKLESAGEYLALVRPDGSVAQEFSFGRQRQDVSFGLVGETNRYFPTPTPGATNGLGVAGFVADTKFSANRGFYSNAFSLTITSATPAAEIWFTLNGNVPAPGAPGARQFTSPIVIANTTMIRAAGFRADHLATDVDTHTFIFPASAASQPANPPGFPLTWASPTRGPQPADYGMDPTILASAPPGYDLTTSLLSLPALSVVAPFEDLFGAARGIYYNSEAEGIDWEREASFELILPDGSPGFQVEAGLRMHGYSSRYHWFTSKHSFHVNFRDRYGPSRLRFPLFPDTRTEDFDQIVLRGCSTDSFPAKDIHVSRWDARRATYLRDQWMRDAMRDLGHPSSHGRYVHLWLNGLYWGLYNVAELLGKGWAAEHFGGNEDEYDVIKDYFVVDDGNAQAWNELETLVAAGVTTEAVYQRIQGNNPDGTRNPNYPIYLDLATYVDYMLLHINAAADDWPDNNWWSCRRRGPASTGFQFVPWDQEISNYSLTATTTAYGQEFERVHTPDRAGYFYDRLRGYGNFRQLFMDRVWFALMDGPLSPESSATRWLARQNEIDRAMTAETARWGDSGHWPASTRADWLNECRWVSNFWSSNQLRSIQRFRNVNLWPLRAPPAVSRPGGYFTNSLSLTIGHTNSLGTIWFTLDGADPRAANAAPSPTARSYSGDLILTNATRLRARVTDGTQWSPPIEATYLPRHALTNLVITELYYHPPSGNSGADGDQFEFIELQNRSLFPLDLRGVFFASGITFSFAHSAAAVAPDGFLVLARDATNFADRFPDAPLHGLYSGRLDNGGEELTMADPVGTVFSRLIYDDAAPWPIRADGSGESLQRVTFNSSVTNASQWIAAPPTPGTASPFLDRDGDALPDRWEIVHGLDPDDPGSDQGAEGDPDQDGRTNREEYLAGTDPGNRLSVLRIDGLAMDAGVKFSFLAFSNVTYTIQHAPALGDAAWSSLVHFPARPTNRVETIFEPLGTTGRFYRVVTPRQQ